MVEFWSAELAKHSGKIFDAQSDQQICYAELNQSVESFICCLPKQKSLIALPASNSIAVLIAYLGLLRAKQCILLIDPELDNQQKQQLFIDYQVDYNLVLPDDLTQPIQLADVQQFFYLEALSANYDTSDAVNSNKQIADEIALLLSTSGSTGSPKLVKLSRDNLQANSTAILRYLPISPDDTLVTSLPMHYSFGLSVIHTHLQVGANLVLNDYSLMQKQFWQLFKQFKPQSFYGVPFSFQLINQLGFARLPLADCKYLAQAGGKMSDELSLALFEWCHKNNKLLYIMYGQTEATARIAYLSPDKLPKKVGFIGQPIPGGKLKLVDQTGQQVTQANRVGELFYQGDNVSLGVANCRQDLQTVEQVSWLATGDLASFDQDGDFKIQGRLKRFIKVTGKRINLDEVEALVLEVIPDYLANIQINIVGEDDALMLVVNQVLSPQDKIDLSQSLATKIAIHVKYIHVVYCKTVPRLSNGKVNYTELLAQAKVNA